MIQGISSQFLATRGDVAVSVGLSLERSKTTAIVQSVWCLGTDRVVVWRPDLWLLQFMYIVYFDCIIFIVFVMCSCFIRQSFYEDKALIAAQYPLEEQAEDFLRLLIDYESNFLISINPLKDILSVGSVIMIPV